MTGNHQNNISRPRQYLKSSLPCEQLPSIVCCFLGGMQLRHACSAKECSLISHAQSQQWHLPLLLTTVKTVARTLALSCLAFPSGLTFTHTRNRLKNPSIMPPKKASFSGYGSGVETGTDTEAPSVIGTKPAKSLTGRKHFDEVHGKGKKLGKHPQPAPADSRRAASTTRRSTRSTSRQPQPPPPEEAPPMPTTSLNTSRSPARPRGRAQPPPSTAEKPKTTTRRARTVSPAKRLIKDSPPPEHRMNPFPPQPEPMTVTDKPAVRNRYGEKVPAPVGIKQKLRQALNFLSDDGVENLEDFEKKLEALKKWLDEDHPHMDGIIADGEEDTELLARRVRYMIWTHENRIVEGAEQWFTRDQFPDSTSMYKRIKPRKGDQWRLHSDGTTTGRPEHPKNQVMQAQDRERIAKAKADKTAAVKASPRKVPPTAAAPTSAAAPATATAAPAAAPAAVASRQPPQLPYPEVWHRKEAARFPYGETPHMEQVLSRQIAADLARGKSQHLTIHHNSQLIGVSQAEKRGMHSRVAPSTRSRRFSETSKSPSTLNSPSLPLILGNCPKSQKPTLGKPTKYSTTLAAMKLTVQRERPIRAEAGRLPNVPGMPIDVSVIKGRPCAIGSLLLYFFAFLTVS